MCSKLRSEDLSCRMKFLPSRGDSMDQLQPQSNRSHTSTRGWFEVDKQGLAKILERKGKEFALLELIQNAWDEPGVSRVSASLEYRRRNRALLVVEDDAP